MQFCVRLGEARHCVPISANSLVPVARGCDAANVAMVTTFSPDSLEAFRAWADEVPDSMRSPPRLRGAKEVNVLSGAPLHRATSCCLSSQGIAAGTRQEHEYFPSLCNSQVAVHAGTKRATIRFPAVIAAPMEQIQWLSYSATQPRRPKP